MFILQGFWFGFWFLLFYSAGFWFGFWFLLFYSAGFWVPPVLFCRVLVPPVYSAGFWFPPVLFCRVLVPPVFILQGSGSSCFILQGSGSIMFSSLSSLTKTIFTAVDLSSDDTPPDIPACFNTSHNCEDENITGIY